jgi:hypothetical protein
MSIQDKTALDAAVDAAWAADGYLLEDGSRDVAKVRQTMVELYSKSKVLSKTDRKTKATTHGAMVTALFPSLAGPDKWDSQDDPEAAELVWKDIDGDLWGLTTTASNSAVQRLVGIVMGNGYVLCRTLLGQDRVKASYITDDVACIQEDYVNPINTALERATTRSFRGIELLMQRKPQVAKAMAAGLERKLKSLQVTTHEQLTLALEAATLPVTDDDPGNGDDNSEADES